MNGNDRQFRLAARPDNARHLRLAKLAVEVLLVLLLAWLAVRFVLALITPVETGAGGAAIQSGPSDTVVINADLSVLERFDPFTAKSIASVSTDTLYADAVETSLNIKLKGVWSWGESGSAILDTGSGNETYIVGDEIQNGVTLQKVETDRVIISRNGVAESVFMEERREAVRPVTQAPAETTATETSTATQVNLARIIEIIDLRPLRDASGGGQSWQVRPGRDAAAFNALGLQSGDILSQINGTPVPSDPDELIEVLQGLASASEVNLEVMRQGRPVSLQFAPSAVE
jgi:general secretion pathway protein C